MRLNTLAPAPGAQRPRKRVGRGGGSGSGKTCGRGNKGQRSRSGGYHKVGFEGGQMPLQRRLPKYGFHSRLSEVTGEVRLHEIDRLTEDTITLEVLKQHNLVAKNIQRAKVIASGKLERAVTIQGLGVTRGARAAVEAAGGKVGE